MAEVIVLGAGPAGLMAADELARAGHHCTVIEATDRVGGMAGSFEIAGQRVDYGSHRLHPAAPAGVLDRFRGLLGDDLQVRERAGRLRLADRWVGFPLRMGDLMTTLPPTLTARLIAETAVGIGQRLVSRDDPATFDAAIVDRFGPTVASAFYGPYARKLYGLAPDELDPELARRRVSAGSPVDIAKRLVQASRPAGRTFLYPKRGYGQLAERLADAAVDAGASIVLDSPVRAVAVTEGAVTVSTPDGSHAGDTLLSTIPATRLAALLDPTPPTAVLAAARQVRVRSMVLAYLVVGSDRYTDFDAHYIPGPETPVARLSEPKNYRDGPDPAGQTVLCAEIPCWPDDELLGWSADDVAALVVDGLARTGLPPVALLGAETRILPSVYPVYDLAGRTARATIDEWLVGIDRVISFGRQGLGVIDNLHHVVEMGSAAAAAIGPDGSIDAGRWATALAGFAANTVED